MSYHKYKYSPRFPEKYKGDPTGIIGRSAWEFRLFGWLDENPSVVEWSSEEIVIPYVCITDEKIHRYFPDIYVKFKNGDKYLIEVKPFYQTQEPVMKQRATKAYINEVYTYGKNISKWKAAKEYAEDRGYKFAIWTERELAKLGLRVTA